MDNWICLPIGDIRRKFKFTHSIFCSQKFKVFNTRHKKTFWWMWLKANVSTNYLIQSEKRNLGAGLRISCLLYSGWAFYFMNHREIFSAKWHNFVNLLWKHRDTHDKVTVETTEKWWFRCGNGYISVKRHLCVDFQIEYLGANPTHNNV